MDRKWIEFDRRYGVAGWQCIHDWMMGYAPALGLNEPRPPAVMLPSQGMALIKATKGVY